MKKFHTLLAGLALCVCMLAACSSCKDDDNKETNYLTSVDTTKSGIVGIWKSTSGSTIYFRYSADGTTCAGYSTAALNVCTTYEIIKSGTTYLLREYDNPTTYTDWTITTLTDASFIFVKGDAKNELVRVN